MIPIPRSVQSRHLTSRPQSTRHAGGLCFSWSLAKIRVAALVLVGAATPAAIGGVDSNSLVKCLCLAWLLGIAILMHRLSQRVVANTIVLSIDQRGILDRRLMSRRIEWQEIQGICRVDVDWCHVVDLRLRWPELTLAETRWWVRIGAHCQIGYGVPAVTISMLFLEGNVSELLNAVALYRADLLHYSNQR